MKKKLILNLLIASSLFHLGCSKSGSSGPAGVEKQADLLEIEMQGTYQALLSPINKEVSGHLNGSLTLVREDDEFVADVRFSGGPASSIHSQNIHIGSRCPTEADDLNQDGFIDGEEGAAVYDQIIIPLDDDISSQWVGLGIFPVTDEYGYYFWSRATSFEKLMNDIKEEDINLKDDYVKLEAHRALNLLGKVIIIKGVPETTVLPETVLGWNRETPHQGLPVACGIIRKLTKVPGVIDNDQTGIPVPDGETIGGSSGADDGAIFTTGSTAGGTGNYGEEEEADTANNSTEYDEETTGGNIIF